MKKSETRNPKSERNPKPETRSVFAGPPIRISDFGLLSDFGFWISGFAVFHNAKSSSNSSVMKM